MASSAFSGSLTQWLTFQRLSVAIALAFTFYVVSVLIYSYLVSPLRKVPGPFLARFTRLWEINAVISANQDDVLLRLHSKYGPVVRIGPNKYSLNSPADTKMIYAPNSGFFKTYFYRAMGDPNRLNIFTMRDEKVHADDKRRIGGLYTVSTLVHYEPSVDAMTKILVSKFEQFSREHRLIAVDTVMQYFAFDLISQITFDKSFGMTERQADYQDAIATIHNITRFGSRIGLVPELVPWVVRLGKLFKRQSPGLVITNFNKSHIDRARRGEEKHAVASHTKAEPFVYKCLELEAQGKMSQNDILNACGSNIAAGSDTTGITLSAIFYHLHRNPASLRKLQIEIDTAAAEGRISSPVTFQEAQALPYLGAVIKEALRLHPAVSSLLPRYVRAGGAQLSGYYFPEGTEVGVNPRVLHLNKAYHGDDCTEWRPERWFDPTLQNDPDRRAAMSFAFGGGSRVCLGRNISLLEISKLVPEIVRRFELVFERDEADEIVEAEVQTGFFSWLKYRCYVKERVFVNEKSG